MAYVTNVDMLLRLDRDLAKLAERDQVTAASLVRQFYAYGLTPKQWNLVNTLYDRSVPEEERGIRIERADNIHYMFKQASIKLPRAKLRLTVVHDGIEKQLNLTRGQPEGLDEIFIYIGDYPNGRKVGALKKNLLLFNEVITRQDDQQRVVQELERLASGPRSHLALTAEFNGVCPLCGKETDKRHFHCEELWGL